MMNRRSACICFLAILKTFFLSSFALAAQEAAKSWQAVNDGVMGGVSDGRFRITDDKTLEFFGPTAFGRRVQGMGPVEPGQINGLGFMLSDKKAGPFKVEVNWVKAVAPSNPAAAMP